MFNLKKIKEQKTTEELLNFGILNIDKPMRKTSFEISDYIRKKIAELHGIKSKKKSRKTSHFGTLDPQVTGVLPVALGRAVKLTGFFIGEDKTYVGVGRFHQPVEMEKLQEKINEKFLGVVVQKPPVKSSVKRQAREREVYDFKILETSEKESEKNKDFLFYVKCQGGTYVRKLISDLGEELGIGGHMLELRRVEAGPFTEYEKEDENENNVSGCVSLYDFEKAIDEYKREVEKGIKKDEKLREMIIPAEIVYELYPVLRLKNNPEKVKQFLTGKPLYLRDIENYQEVEKIKPDSIVSVFLGDRFIGMYRIQGKNEQEIFAKPEFVYN